MKRSVSPTSVQPNQKKPRLSGFLSSLKNFFSGNARQNTSQANYIANEDFPTSFTSRKRRDSVQKSFKSMSLQVPRSLSGSSIPTYQSLSNSLQNEKVAIAGEMEQRRMSVVAEIGLEAFKEDSPMLFVPKNQILPTNPNEMELEEELPLVIEHEFAPLYQDAEGNLVRPPVINLDPRERYHLLQLKKSMEASEYLQNRLKYMVDPDETTSIKKPSNKVDSSTQTFTRDFLDKTLHFNALRTKLALKSRKQKRSKQPRGMFSGEFFYDQIEPKPVKVTDSTLTGYLGTLSEPSFKTNKKETPKSLPDADDESGTKRQKSTTQRVGLDEAIRTGESRDAVLDEDFVKKAENIASVIKLKTQQSPEKKTTVGPGSGFNFEITKKDFGSILQKRKEDEELVHKGSTPIPEKTLEKDMPKPGMPLFGKSMEKSSLANQKPLFGAAKPLSSDSAEKPLFTPKEPQKPLLGNTEKPVFVSNEKPLFAPKQTPSFGNLKTPLFAGQSVADSDSGPRKKRTRDSTEDLGSQAKPTFSFGKTDEKSTSVPLFGKAANEPAKSFNFGTEGGASAEKQTFSFGAKPEANPKIAFGKAELEKRDAPIFVFGSKNDNSQPEEKKEAPTIVFGEKKASDSADKKETPLFSFGGNKAAGSAEKKDASLFSYGEKAPESNNKKETPSFSFGEKKANAVSFGEKKTDAPSFSFGEKKTETAPSFSFGEKKDAPSISLGEQKSDSAPPFTSGEKKSDSTTSFSFGQNSDSADKPAFSFGKSSENTTETKPVSFGTREKSEGNKTETPMTSMAEAPRFLFASKSDSTPAFSFGSKADSKKESSEPPKLSFGQAGSLEKQSTTTSFFGNKETPTFSFGQKPPVSAKESTPAFSFGQKPADTKESTPAFSFSSKESTPKPQFNANDSKPGFSFGNQATPVPFGNTTQQDASKSTFSFGVSATADPASIFGGGGGGSTSFNFTPMPSAAQPSGFGNPVNSSGFGNANSNSNSGFGFGAPNLAAPTPQQGAFGGFGSRDATPTAGFGQPQPGSTPNTGFGQPQPGAPMFGGNQQNPGFNFSNGGNAPAFNSAPGSFGQASRENTPTFNGNQGFNGSEQSFTPPLVLQRRKIAQMRPRKRY